MQRSVAKIITGVVVAAAGIYLGLRLAIYAEKDDAPGGVIIGALLMLCSLGFGIWLALRGRSEARPL